ncbi:MAG: creatininase family protein [Bradyrhizobium sp.]|nr:creatininase family protein [Bradyrhizobium sp.]
MALTSRHWWDLTTREFAALDPERLVAIVPVAAVEQHGPHLPVRVDAAINAGIVARAIELMPPDCPALVLPMTPVGKSDEHVSFPGTLTLSHQTLARVWYELGECVHRAGLRRILFFNSHGGQPQLLEIVCRDLRVKCEMLALTTMWPQLAEIGDLFEAAEIKHGIHGGGIETSMMLHLHPELVDMELAENFTSVAAEIERDAELLGRGAAYFGWQAQDLNPKGACGNAAAATAELGKELVERAARGLARLVGEISDYPLSRLAASTAFDRP